MNESLFRAVNNLAGRSVLLDACIIFFTDSAGIVLVFALLLYAMHMFYHGGRREARYILAAFTVAGLTWAIGFVGKMIFKAPRPFMSLTDVRELLIYGQSDAFPSGHATFYFALAGALFLYNKRLGMAAMAVAAMIGLARVAAGVHWPSDVAAGALLGITVALIANWLITYYTARRW